MPRPADESPAAEKDRLKTRSNGSSKVVAVVSLLVFRRDARLGDDLLSQRAGAHIPNAV